MTSEKQLSVVFRDGSPESNEFEEGLRSPTLNDYANGRETSEKQLSVVFRDGSPESNEFEEGLRSPTLNDYANGREDAQDSAFRLRNIASSEMTVKTRTDTSIITKVKARAANS